MELFRLRMKQVGGSHVLRFTVRMKTLQLEVIEFKEGTIKVRSSLHIPTKSMDDMRKKIAKLINDDPVVAASFQNFVRIEIASPKPVEG